MKGALEIYETAERLVRKILGNNHPELATVMNNIGEVYRKQCKYDLSLKKYNESLDLLK